MKQLIILLLTPLLSLGQSKKSGITTSQNSGSVYAKLGKAQLEKSDTIHACLNFLRAKSLGYYKLENLYGEDEENVDDVVTYCYDEKNILKKTIRNNFEFKSMNYPPLEFSMGEVFTSQFGEPVLKLSMHNISDRVVDAYKCVVKCYNRFGEPVKGLENSNTGIITYQEKIDPGEEGNNYEGYTFTFFQGITKIKVTLLKVHFEDGTVWIPKKGQIFTTTVNSSR